MSKVHKPFRESTFYSSYKKIRNQFRRWSPVQIIDACIDYLYSPTQNELDQLKKHPWLVLLLIKWVLLDEEFQGSDKQPLEPPQFNRILQMMHDLGAKVRMPSEYAHHALFFRNMAYQQFLYQYAFGTECLGRQKILFGGVEQDHLFKRKFNELIGLELDRFLELALILACRFIVGRDPRISSQWFDTVTSHYTSEEIENLLKAISIDLDHLRLWLLETEESTRRSYEFWEQTPFLKYPLIRVGTQFVCVYPNILFRALEHFIYDKLRTWNSTKFMAKFGEVFERYVEKGLSYAGVPFVREDILSQELAGTGKVIDFLIADNDTNILLDAKAVEMAHQGKVTHRSNIVKDRVKTSVIEAIDQSFDVLRRLENCHSSNPIVKHRSNNYLLVVTFKELYLGNGRNFYDSVAREKLDDIFAEYGESPQVPLENMYFIDIEEFDLFVQMVRSGKMSFSAGLARAKESDSDARSRKFDFRLHLRSWDRNPELPSYVRNTTNGLFQKIMKVLKEQEVQR